MNAAQDNTLPFFQNSSLEDQLWRSALYAEVHTRPFPLIHGSTRVSQIVLLREQDSTELHSEHQHLQKLCDLFQVTPPAPNASCFFQDFGNFEFRWELHTEFSTYTVLCKESQPSPFENNAWKALPNSWVQALPGKIVAATHITLEEQHGSWPKADELDAHFEEQRKIASSALDGKAEIWTAFKLHSDGFGRYMIFYKDLNPCETGRLLQKILEIESYRLLALMALPLVRKASPALSNIENELSALTKKLSQIEAYNEREILNKLTSFAADIEHTRSEISFRISATRAYYALVMERLSELGQQPLNGLQTLSEFLDRRLTPGYRTCEAIWDRLENISQRIDRASELITTEVNLSIEEQNQVLLDSMNRRGRVQLRMQQTFEGLSMVAICYYLVGLLEQAIPALKSLGINIDHHIMIAIAIPVSMLSVFVFNKLVVDKIRKENQVRKS